MSLLVLFAPTAPAGSTTGVAALTLAGVTVSSSGGVADAGTAAIALGGVTLAASGTTGGEEEASPWLAWRPAARSSGRTAWRRLAA